MTVTLVPPEAGQVFGEIDLTVGAGESTICMMLGPCCPHSLPQSEKTAGISTGGKV
jgi:hypothetical protein